MREITGDIWKFHDAGFPICITTNGNCKGNGAAVMGRGIAAEAARRFPDLPKWLGDRLRTVGNDVYWHEKHRLFTFPTKRDWWEKSCLDLIERSAYQLSAFQHMMGLVGPIYLPRPGCGNGGLKWEEVKPVLGALGNNFVAVNR